MLYIQKGFKTSELTAINEENSNDFEDFIVLDIQTYNKNENKQKVKENKAKYFIGGDIISVNGVYKRNNKNLLSRSLICIDYDNVNMSNEELKNKIRANLQNYNYMLYPTISHTIDNPRYRLIIEPSRPLNEKEYKSTILEINEKLGLNFDPSSKTYSQLQGLPITTSDNLEEYKKDIIINKGNPYPITELLSSASVEVNNNANMSVNIEEGQAVEMVKEYCLYHADTLQNYDKALSCIMVIAKSVQNGTISENTGYKCCEILGCDNREWIDGNIKKLKKELKNENIYTEYDFYTKFNPIFYKEPKTNKELCEKLDKIGLNIRIKNTDEKGKMQILKHHQIGDTLINNLPLVLIGEDKDTSLLYFYDYDEGIYVNSDTTIDKYIVLLDKRFNPSNFKQVHLYLRTQVKHIREYKDRYRIAVKNGIFNLKTKELEEFNPKYYFTSKIKTNYNKDAQNPIEYFNVDSWLSSIACGDDEIITLLWQMINECLNPNHTRGKIGILLGDGNNGKGTFQSLIENVIGKENISSLKPPQFAERFTLNNLIGKTCNIGDDISNKYLDDISNLFSIATGDVVTIDRKNREPVSVCLKLFCMFSANSMPKMRNKSDGTYRRLLIVPFNADFNGDIENKNIKDKYIKDKAVCEYVLYRAINMKFEKFSSCKKVVEALEEYKQENDCLLAYINDEYIEKGYHDLQLVPFGFIKNNFANFLKYNNIDQHINYALGNNVIKILNKKFKDRKYIKDKKRLTKEQKEVIKNKLCDGDFLANLPKYNIYVVNKIK